MSLLEPADVARVLPRVDGPHAWFWEPTGTLRLLRCGACRAWHHPPGPDCPLCAGPVTPETTAGRGRIYAFTVNHKDWTGQGCPPYVIAVVELDEQPGLRVTTNIVGCDPDAVRTGMTVILRPHRHDQIELPLFTPADPT